MWISLVLLAPVAGCLPSLPPNTKGEQGPLRSILFEADGATLSEEEGVPNAFWLEVTRVTGSGSVGGYLSRNEATDRSLIILLHGASTFTKNGGLDSALLTHTLMGPPYWDQGYLTLSLVYTECGTPYGQADVADLIEVLDWLDRGGRDLLNVERVYLLGYSTGATIAMLACQQRTVTAGASISGLTSSAQLERLWSFYRTVASTYPTNEGMCQLASTLDTYGPPGSQGWAALDTVGRVESLRNPMIFFHGTADVIWDVDNLLSLQGAYEAALARGAALQEHVFSVLNGVDHFGIDVHPDVTRGVLDFFSRHR